MDMISDTLGWSLDRRELEVVPVQAERRIVTTELVIEPGHVRGLKQVCTGVSHEREVIRLVFVAALESEQDHDTTRIGGHPSLEVTVRGALGDAATVAIAVNAIRRALDAAPGLSVMRDLPGASSVAAWTDSTS